MLTRRAPHIREKRQKRGGLHAAIAAVYFFPPILLLVSGCGGISANRDTSASQLVLHAPRTTIDTNTTDQLSATLSSGAHADVIWSIAAGQNDASIGQGTISASGLYTPPPLLSQDVVTVGVKAALASDPATTASYIVTVTPGFVQSLMPQNASLAPGGSVHVTGEIAEINSGSVHWTLAATATGGAALGAQYGSIREGGCIHSARAYTSCTATYIAPPSRPADGASLYLVGSFTNNARSTATVHILLNQAGFNSSPLENQKAQTGDVEMGSSGGNANDYDSSQNARGDQYVNDCCGGTLGALVADRNSNLYILSNNHVLAESDQGRPGDTIVEPALIDLNCDPQAGRAVGALRYVVPLESTQTNVDAALAAATPAVDPSGAILQLGSLINGRLSAAAPAAGTGESLTASRLDGLQVAKSGRTTGLTCSTVDAVNLSVQVDYYYDCAETKPFYTKTYTNQIGIPGTGFADSGDSGALVLDAGNAEPIGLFFASGSGGDSGFSVANPIQDVLSELGQKSQAEGQQFQIVGGAPHPVTCSNYDGNVGPVAVRSLSPEEAAVARSAADTATAALMRPGNGVLGVDTGRSLDQPDEPAVIVYVDKNNAKIAIPETIDGLRTLVILTDEAGADAGVTPNHLPQGIHLPANLLRAAARVQQRYAPKLMSDPAFFGVGVTQSYDNPAEAALLVLVDVTKTPASMPDVVGGLRVRYMKLNRLHVTRSKSAGAARPTSCQLRAARR